MRIADLRVQYRNPRPDCSQTPMGSLRTIHDEVDQITRARDRTLSTLQPSLPFPISCPGCLLQALLPRHCSPPLRHLERSLSPSSAASMTMRGLSSPARRSPLLQLLPLRPPRHNQRLGPRPLPRPTPPSRSSSRFTAFGQPIPASPRIKPEEVSTVFLNSLGSPTLRLGRCNLCRRGPAASREPPDTDSVHIIPIRQCLR